ncbi:MAG: putative nuclear exosomal helicase [Frankiales bacterium]|nr:putative nuclear exosomal helicase [Frankiales bacterium]
MVTSAAETDPAPTPAERYAAFRRGQGGAALTAFEAGYPFGLDAFQRTACKALEDGRGVLVAAPTGAGKTVVGEFAVHLALREGRKCFYTTPIKALSNQKHKDLVERYGADQVGLLTGDNSVNGDAPVVVMTTEVLRNMLYAGSDALRGLSHVVMDEVHYLADRARGVVWDEVIIHLPDVVRLVSLSATVSNAEEFADWLVTVRGDTEVVVEEHRPVPLSQHVLVGGRLHDLFEPGGEGKVNRDLERIFREESRFSPKDHRGRPPRRSVPSRADVVERLGRDGLLPTITFIFSRAGCAAAVQQCVQSGLRLNTPEERERVRLHVEERTKDLPDDDLRVLGYWEWLDALERGVAAHHAGMLPTFKEVVEELFTMGLVKAVFATETLALGINMPARSVVLEKLVKWNGETHADLQPGEYTQLTGRAGRRGIDVEGHAVVLWQPGFDPRQLAGLASTRTYPLRSSFRPSYNMAVNLVGAVGREQARALLESSFAQFQADKSVVGLARQVARNLEALEGYREAMTCHLGDAVDYARLRKAVKDRETELSRQGASQRRAAAAESLERLKPGDVVRVPQGRRSGLAVVVDPGVGVGESHPLVVTEDRWSGRLSSADFPGPVEPVGRVRLPRDFNARSPQARRDVASSIRALGIDGPGKPEKRRSSAADDEKLLSLRAALRRHPVHGCDDRETHLRWGERWTRLRAETDQLERRVTGKTSSIARTFDKVCALLDTLGYLDGDEVTDAGRSLARVYSEVDLLVVEAVRSGAWDGLSAAELAAVVSTLVYESRRTDEGSPRVPGGAVQAAVEDLFGTWQRLSQVEADAGLAFLREPDPGFAWAAWRWAGGARLEHVLDDGSDGGELTAGDFVRWCKQLVDLLGQVADVAATERPALRKTCREAIEGVRRGVVAYSSVA